MTLWMSIFLCCCNVATSLCGAVALKHAVTVGSVVWSLVAAACWIGTAICMALLLEAKPMIWIALASSSLSVLGSVAIGFLVFGEDLLPMHIVGLVLVLAALVVTSLTAG